MTDISKETVERAIYPIIRMVNDGGNLSLDQCGAILDVARAQNARIAEQDAKIASLVDALQNIATHREKCHAYDADMGHVPREFDIEDLKIFEYAARAALATTEAPKFRETP